MCLLEEGESPLFARGWGSLLGKENLSVGYKGLELGEGGTF